MCLETLRNWDCAGHQPCTQTIRPGNHSAMLRSLGSQTLARKSNSQRQGIAIPFNDNARKALYVVGSIAAVPFLPFAVYSAAALAGYFGGTPDPPETEIFAERMTNLAVVSWLAGRVARALSG